MKKTKKHLNKGSRERPDENYFPGANELLEQAFSITSKVSVSRRGIPPIKVIRRLNALKIQTFGEFLQKKLTDLAKLFPHLERLDPFYLDLIGILANTPRLKTNLSNVSASARIIKRLRFVYAHNCYTAISISEANSALNAYQGRVSSVMKKLGPVLKELKVDSKAMRELPAIDFDAPTVVLAGYPNVGKTTLLKRLTGASAKISPYAFTTKQINTGYFEHKYRRIQVLDTPGLLDRTELNAVEKKALAAIQHLATLIVFIIDPTLACGYTLQEQLSLLSHTKERFAGRKIIVAVNKVDYATEQELDAATDPLKDYTVAKDSELEGMQGQKVREEIAKAL
ncbi:MAG TPA: GTP-binding protein [Candidatus Diapherotrites archaeon]|uniref:GTP-binding protein n=1 Tax=Candidatus Iainarchaeum sp. TaxID=3101447 RepID=A0A7J4IVG2_9ARCH|nr:GTP-binding protein [Candidatus Diapherotrites archaeon]